MPWVKNGTSNTSSTNQENEEGYTSRKLWVETRFTSEENRKINVTKTKITSEDRTSQTQGSSQPQSGLTHGCNRTSNPRGSRQGVSPKKRMELNLVKLNPLLSNGTLRLKPDAQIWLKLI